MSELTPCNYCTFQDIIRRHQGATVELHGFPGSDWVECTVDGKRVASFMELTEECVC